MNHVLRKSLAFIMSLVLVSSMSLTMLIAQGGQSDVQLPSEPTTTISSESSDLGLNTPTVESSLTRIDLLTFTDSHGHVDSLMNDADPGAARLVAYAEWMRLQNPNPNNVMILPGGDEFHGHPLSNYLRGAPTVSMLNYLGVEYMALGNHEFSFGGIPKGPDGKLSGELNATFLAADLFYAPGHPRAGQQPDWVRPYAVVSFENDIKIGLIGFMTAGMSHLVTGEFMSEFELRTPTVLNPDPAWITYYEEMIATLRDDYGVDAVVAVTHMFTNALNHPTEPGGETGRLAAMFDLDAVIGGHTHQRHNFELHGTRIMEAGWHGRTMGRISLFFDEENNLDEVTGWLSPLPPGLPGSNTESIRDFNRPAGFTFDGTPFPAAQHPEFHLVQHHYEAFSAILAEYAEEAEAYLGRVLGPRGIYSQTRNDRNVWVTRLVTDYVTRAENNAGGWTVPHWQSEEASWVYVSNFGGWRNVGPFTFDPSTPVSVRQMYSTMPFNNAILLYEMYGKDLLVLLNMQASASTHLDPAVFGLNGGQPPVVDGAFTLGQQIGDLTVSVGVSNNLADGVNEFPLLQWYLTHTGEPIRNDNTVYRVIGSNFTQGPASALLPGATPQGGGDRFPIPGTTHGNARGFTFLGMPMALMSDGTLVPYNEIPTDNTLWEVEGLRTLRSAMIAQQEYRSENPDFTGRLTVAATGHGRASITSPFAPGERTTNVNVLPQHVTVTAQFDEETSEDVVFVGWFKGNRRVSTNMVYTFVQHEEMVLEARFALASDPVIEFDSVVDIALSSDDFSILVQALTAAGLVDVLDGEGPFTVFAPTNAAFEALIEKLGITLEDLLAEDQLYRVLLAHVVSGRILSTDITDGLSAPSLNDGFVLRFGLNPPAGAPAGLGVFINEDTEIVVADILAFNGVVHVIDQVLIPENFSLDSEIPQTGDDNTLLWVFLLLALGGGLLFASRSKKEKVIQ